MSYRYRSRRDDSTLRERLLALARVKPRFGYRGLWVMLTSQERVNHKRVWRAYRDLGLSVKRTRLVDSSTRECLAPEVDTSLPSRRVTRALAKIIDQRGGPVAIRSDDGPEASSRHFLAWCIEKRIDAVHI